MLVTRTLLFMKAITIALPAKAGELKRDRYPCFSFTDNGISASLVNELSVDHEGSGHDRVPPRSLLEIK